MPVAETSVVSLLRVLADPTRLRVLALLSQAELSVGEIARCLAMGQSRVSNHLKVLREAELIEERHEGSFTYCRAALANGQAGALWSAMEPGLDGLEQREADERRLAAVLGDRSDSRAFFDRIAGDWDLIGSDFTSGAGRLEVLGCLVPEGLVVADVGCGTGYLARALSRRVSKVVCIDTSEAMLGQAQENLAGVPAELDFRTGAMESLPLADDEVDAACAHMVLHHLTEPRTGLAEMARAVKPGGHVVCVELLPHHESWMHEAMADTRLGIEPGWLAGELEAVGLTDISHELLPDGYVVENPGGKRIELPLFLIRGRLPASHS